MVDIGKKLIFGVGIGAAGLILSAVSDTVFKVPLIWEKQSVKNSVKTLLTIRVSTVGTIELLDKINAFEW